MNLLFRSTVSYPIPYNTFLFLSVFSDFPEFTPVPLPPESFSVFKPVKEGFFFLFIGPDQDKAFAFGKFDDFMNRVGRYKVAGTFFPVLGYGMVGAVLLYGVYPFNITSFQNMGGKAERMVMDVLMLVFCTEMMDHGIKRQPLDVVFCKHGIHLFTPGFYGHHILENNSID